MKGFKEAYNNLRQVDAKEVQRAIMQGCDWNNRQLFCMKKNGKRTISLSEQTVITTVFRNKGINALTGAQI